MPLLEGVLREPVNEKENRVFKAMLPFFEAAVEYSAKGDWQNEFLKLQEAQRTAQSLAPFRGFHWFTLVELEIRRAGLIYRGAELLHVIVAESGLELVNRKQQLMATRPVGGLSAITIWSDRIIGGTQVVPIDEFTSATVSVDGVNQVTQRPTLTRMALLSPLPGSALIPGLALQKKTRTDFRDCLFTVSSVDWQFSCSIRPSDIQEAKAAAERINIIAAKLERAANRLENLDKNTNSVGDELAKLSALLKEGVLTQVEFDALKAKLIGDNVRL